MIVLKYDLFNLWLTYFIYEGLTVTDLRILVVNKTYVINLLGMLIPPRILLYHCQRCSQNPVKHLNVVFCWKLLMHQTDKYCGDNAPCISQHNAPSQHSLIIWPIWLNGWVFTYEPSGFESRCCQKDSS